MVMTQPNNDIKVFKKHRVNGNLLTLLLSMGGIRQIIPWQTNNDDWQRFLTDLGKQWHIIFK